VYWKVSRIEVLKSGELGSLFRTDSLEIWKKQVDGKWKCIVNTYNSDSPVQIAPEGGALVTPASQ